jgi:GTPase SAR1 family protein
MKRLKNTLAYLEQVRQHMARLPSIDPNTRTLLITGYPNVGKSSFMNKVTRANVDVQPYAFTTKSLFVGHMDYKYLRWQVIDTPGILDHPLEDRNCFTLDHEVLTELGFMSLARVKEHLTQHGVLSIACPDGDGALAFHTITMEDVTEAVSENFVELSQHKDISLLVTGNHRMWVKLGEAQGETHQWRYDASSAKHPHFEIRSAKTIVEYGSESETNLVQLECSAGKVAAPEGPLECATVLGLTTDDQIDAFVELYGYWLRDGSLDTDVQKISFSPRKMQDQAYLESLLSRTGLPRLSSSAHGAHGWSRTEDVADDNLCCFLISSSKWWVYFYSKYENKPRVMEEDAPREASTADGAKWFWNWVLKGLGASRLRLMVRGLCVADGSGCDTTTITPGFAKEGSDLVKPDAHIHTSCERFRDELITVLCAAGYTTHFVLDREVTRCNRSWVVYFSDDLMAMRPKLTISTAVKEVKLEAQPVWCVTVPTERQLIVVRRVLERDQDGGVTSASRPVVMGNTIEMQSITALAHLRACILYFMDLSEQCGYSVQQQVSLFHNIKPLFTSKPLLLVLNKSDLVRLADSSTEVKKLVQSILDEGATMIEASNMNEEGIMEVKQTVI